MSYTPRSVILPCPYLSQVEHIDETGTTERMGGYLAQRFYQMISLSPKRPNFTPSNQDLANSTMRRQKRSTIVVRNVVTASDKSDKPKKALTNLLNWVAIIVPIATLYWTVNLGITAQKQVQEQIEISKKQFKDQLDLSKKQFEDQRRSEREKDSSDNARFLKQMTISQEKTRADLAYYRQMVTSYESLTEQNRLANILAIEQELSTTMPVISWDVRLSKDAPRCSVEFVNKGHGTGIVQKIVTKYEDRLLVDQREFLDILVRDSVISKFEGDLTQISKGVAVAKNETVNFFTIKPTTIKDGNRLVECFRKLSLTLTYTKVFYDKPLEVTWDGRSIPPEL